MKKKYFFRGLGFGLIIGALVMMVGIKSGSFADTKKNDPSKEDAVGVVASEEATESAKTTETTTEEKKKGGSITIRPGMYAEAISQALYDIGMVDSVQDFYDYLVSSGNSMKLMCGTFTFKGDETYDEMITIMRDGPG